jgi:RNA polymerase sigma-70 factor (ECF subfamily)
VDRDESTFRELYRIHTPALYLFVLRIVGGKSEDAEELVQETWIRAIIQLPNFRWESSLKTWLCAIALNCCREIARSNQRKKELKLVKSDSIPAKNSSGFSDIEKCISNLPEGCREVLVLHDIEGYTHKEIAGMMEITEGTSKSQLFRARAKLREMLKPFQEIS